VCIDQSRDAGVTRKVDHLGTGRYRDVAACHALHAVVFDDDHRVRDDAARAVDQLAESDDLRRGRRL
jgi:hypothetical protein